MNVEFCEDNFGTSKKMCYFRKNKARAPHLDPPLFFVNNKINKISLMLQFFFMGSTAHLFLKSSQIQFTCTPQPYIHKSSASGDVNLLTAIYTSSCQKEAEHAINKINPYDLKRLCLCSSRVAHQAGTSSMKQLGVFPLPLDGMIVHRIGLHPNIKFTGTHLYPWVEGGTVGALCTGSIFIRPNIFQDQLLM